MKSWADIWPDVAYLLKLWTNSALFLPKRAEEVVAMKHRCVEHNPTECQVLFPFFCHQTEGMLAEISFDSSSERELIAEMPQTRQDARKSALHSDALASDTYNTLLTTLVRL